MQAYCAARTWGPHDVPLLATASLCEIVRVWSSTLTHTHWLVFLLQISSLGQLPLLWQPFQPALSCHFRVQYLLLWRKKMGLGWTIVLGLLTLDVAHEQWRITFDEPCQLWQAISLGWVEMCCTSLKPWLGAFFWCSMHLNWHQASVCCSFRAAPEAADA